MYLIPAKCEKCGAVFRRHELKADGTEVCPPPEENAFLAAFKAEAEAQAESYRRWFKRWFG